jgi:hypothetical protein
MAKIVTLVHAQATLHVPAPLVVRRRDPFPESTGLADISYHLKSHISVRVFRDVISALEGTTVKIKSNTFKGLSQL